MALARAGEKRGCDDELLGRDLDHEDRTGDFRMAEQVFMGVFG